MLAQNAEYLSLPASPLSHGHIQQEYKHYVGGKCKRNVFLELKSLIACHTNDVVLKAFISFAHLHFLMLQCGEETSSSILMAQSLRASHFPA